MHKWLPFPILKKSIVYAKMIYRVKLYVHFMTINILIWMCVWYGMKHAYVYEIDKQIAMKT